LKNLERFYDFNFSWDLVVTDILVFFFLFRKRALGLLFIAGSKLICLLANSISADRVPVFALYRIEFRLAQ